MTIAVVGGHNRFKSEIESFSKEKGIRVKFIEKRCPKASECISMADYVIVLTCCVSHDLVSLCKKLAKERCIFCSAKGLCNLKKTILELKQLNS